MIDLSSIPNESSLIDDSLKKQLSAVFSKLQSPVVIKAIADVKEQKGMELAAFLKAIAALSPKLSLELYLPEEAGKVPELDASYLPVTGLFKDGIYGRAAFCGIPGGKEINSFVLAVYNLSGPGKEVDKRLKKRIDSLSKPVKIKICVSLACHYCPAVVAACQQIAILNPQIEAVMIDAGLYPQLVEQYKIERIPMMILNDSQVILGSKTMEEIVTLLNK